MPPAPIGAMTSYRPKRVPAASGIPSKYTLDGLQPGHDGLQILARAACQRVDFLRCIGPRRVRLGDRLADQRHFAARARHWSEQLVMIDLAEARAAGGPRGDRTIILDHDAADLLGAACQVRNRIDVRIEPRVAAVVEHT